MKWIPTEPNTDGSITIKGITYREDGTGYRIKDGFVFIDDQQHSGYYHCTRKLAEKYGIEAFEHMDEYELEHRTEEEIAKGVDHWIGIDHVWGTINGDGTEYMYESPFGEPKSKEFVAWWLGIDPAFWDEEEAIWMGWADG